MFAVAFDLIVAETEKHHPKGVTQAYIEIGMALQNHVFRRVQGSLYICEDENLTNLFCAIRSLQDRSWFRKSVRDIRAFRIEHWSDFTPIVKAAEE